MQITKPLNKTLAMLESMTIQTSKEELSQKSLSEGSANEMKLQRVNSLNSAWQRKWLDLEVTHPEIQTMAKEAQDFCSRFYLRLTSHSTLIIAGKSGTGKTRVARAVARYARAVAFHAMESRYWPNPPSCLFASWSTITDGFKLGEYGFIEDANNADLLIIDDLGSEHDPSTNAADKLCQILSKRERKFNLITTNIQSSAWPKRFDARIADRLLRNSVVIDLNGVKSFAVVG